jgi:hypothetical protein
VDLESLAAAHLAEHRTRGIALATALLAAPVLIVGHGGPAALLLSAALISGALVLESRSSSKALAIEGIRHLSSAPRRVARATRLRAGWQMVERDGQRVLVMTWTR